MSSSRKILFKVDNTIMVEELRDLTIDEITRMKELVAQECECGIDEVEVDTIEAEIELSDEVDCTIDMEGVGVLVYWKSLEFRPIVGVSCSLVEGSDEYLDRINDNTISDYLEFIT